MRRDTTATVLLLAGGLVGLIAMLAGDASHLKLLSIALAMAAAGAWLRTWRGSDDD